MTNHVHLLFTPQDEAGCSLLMRDVGRDYAAYFNRRYERTGSLWERPFKSCLVDSAEYVLACYRYIERNPVRAHMVQHPSEHPWSSFAGNAARRLDALLTPHAEYEALSVDNYLLLLADADQDEFLRAVREATHAGYPLVGERLRSQLEQRGVRLERRKPGPAAEDSPAADEHTAELALTP